MNRIVIVLGCLMFSSISFGANFSCQGTGILAFPSKIISFDLNKSETKELVVINGIKAQVSLDASNKDGKPYLAIETIGADNLDSYAALTAKGPIVKDMVVILLSLHSPESKFDLKAKKATFTLDDFAITCMPL